MVILLAMPRYLPTTTRRAAPWSELHARRYLDNVIHERAGGPGMSDRTLERLALLTQPESAASRAAFSRALANLGWPPRRIQRAVRDVAALSRVRPRVDVLGTLRNVGGMVTSTVRDNGLLAIVAGVVLIASGSTVAGVALIGLLLFSSYRRPPRRG